MSHTIQSGLQDPELFELALVSKAEAEGSAPAAVLRMRWVQHAIKHKMPTEFLFDAHRDAKGRAVFSLRAQNGYHESFEGYEHALSLLVAAHDCL